MSLPEPLREPGTDRLAPAEAPGTGQPVAQPRLAAGRPGRLRSRARTLAKGLAYRTVGRVVDARTADLREATGQAIRSVNELTSLDARLRQLGLDHELQRAATHAATVNLESLKREVRALEHTLQELGMAFAPATGLAGAGARFAELRERVNGIDRRLRSVPAPAEAPAGGPAPGPDGGASATDSHPQPGGSPQSALFDYVGFERRFRGDPARVQADLRDRYGSLLAAHPPVVDLGCGRAELLAWLAGQGIETVGVDTDPSMVAEARGAGLEVHQMDALAFLRAREPGSLGAIIATHVVEHLELDALIQLLETAVRALRPGGLFIAETPNPASLVVLGNSYVMDPTHVRPLHPSLLSFLCEGAGFRDVRLRFFAPAEAYHLRPVDVPDAPAWAGQLNEDLGRLNEVLFGPQDYAVVASTAVAQAPTQGTRGPGPEAGPAAGSTGSGETTR